MSQTEGPQSQVGGCVWDAAQAVLNGVDGLIHRQVSDVKLWDRNTTKVEWRRVYDGLFHSWQMTSLSLFLCPLLDKQGAQNQIEGWKEFPRHHHYHRQHSPIGQQSVPASQRFNDPAPANAPAHRHTHTHTVTVTSSSSSIRQRLDGQKVDGQDSYTCMGLVGWQGGAELLPLPLDGPWQQVTKGSA